MTLSVAASPHGCLLVVSCLQDLVNILSELADWGLMDAAILDDAEESLRAHVYSTCFCVPTYSIVYSGVPCYSGYDTAWDQFLMLKTNLESTGAEGYTRGPTSTFRVTCAIGHIGCCDVIDHP